MSVKLRELDAAAKARWAGQAPLRILLGPYHYRGHFGYMHGAFDDHDAVTFGTHAHCTLKTTGLESLESIYRRLPDDWRPDLILLWRPEYGSIPPDLHEADVPVVALTSDWYIAFSDTLEATRFSNLLVTGTRGERVFRAAGFDNVIAMPMLGFQPGVDGTTGAEHRDIDVFTATNPNFSVHKFRQKVIARLMDLPPDVELAVRANISRQEYNDFLGRSRIFVNNSVIGEVNMKVYEATAAGCCLFLEEGHLDIEQHLVPDESVVLYTLDNLNEKIRYYLEHEEERAAIAARGHEAMQGKSYRSNMNDILARLRDMGRDALFGMGREVRRASNVSRRRHFLAHSLNHSHGDLAALLRETSQLTPDADPNDVLLEGIAHFLGRDAKLEAARSCWTFEELLDRLRAARDREGSKTALRFGLAVLSRQLAPPTVAIAETRRCIAELEDGAPVPFGRGDFYILARNPRFEFERTAWEQVERGLPPDAALRPLLLEQLYRQLAELLVTTGSIEEAVAALRRAVEILPDGAQARPLLARVLLCQKETAGAAKTLADHLQKHPMDTDSYGNTFELQLCAGLTDAALRTYRSFERIATVLGDAALENTRLRMANMLASSGTADGARSADAEARHNSDAVTSS